MQDALSENRSPPVHRPVLPRDDIASYRSEGYITVHGVIARDLLDRLIAVTDGLIDRSRALTASDDFSTWRPTTARSCPGCAGSRSPLSSTTSSSRRPSTPWSATSRPT